MHDSLDQSASVLHMTICGGGVIVPVRKAEILHRERHPCKAIFHSRAKARAEEIVDPAEMWRFSKTSRFLVIHRNQHTHDGNFTYNPIGGRHINKDISDEKSVIRQKAQIRRIYLNLIQKK